MYLAPSSVTFAAFFMLFLGAPTVYLTNHPLFSYGKHNATSKYLIPAKLGWILMESPSVIFSCLSFISCSEDWINILQKPNFWIFLLFQLHYINRSFIYPFKLRGSDMPIQIVVSGTFVCTFNGLIIGSSVGQTEFNSNWFFDPRFVFGVILFLAGFFANIHCDSILASLRTQTDKNTARSYKIPTGGLYNYVSAGNYFGELVEWFGFFLLNWSLPTLIWVFFVCSNLIPRSIRHHNWYRNKFDNYPEARKIIIPFVF